MTREDMLRGMIEEYRKKIETYQAMIREWETELGSHRAGPPSPVSASSDSTKKHSAGSPASLVREYQFFNKSQPEAAKELLEMVGHPLSGFEPHRRLPFV
jgi:hypothetical protein